MNNVGTPLSFPKGCPVIYPGENHQPITPKILKVENLQYVTYSNGKKRIYTNSDRVVGYSTSDILNPNNFSYVNLYINAMMQPTPLYQVKKGLLVLKSIDIPPEGTPIILQFIKIYGL